MEEHGVRICSKIQEADWAKEKHVPVIECADKVQRGAWTAVKVLVGKSAEHPNTTEHHIRWINLYFAPKDEKFAYDLGHFEFNAHGESAGKPNEGPAHTKSEVSLSFRAQKPGTLHAMAYCNVHGLWEGSKVVEVT